MEINGRIYGNENRKQSNKAVGDLKKTEEAVQAAQTEFDIWENEEEIIIPEEGIDENPTNKENQAMSTPNIPLTAFHTPNTPMTPTTQGGSVW